MGEFIAIMGPSGSEKSTLLNILASIEDYESGKVVIDERNLQKVNSIDTRRYTTSMIFQDFKSQSNLNNANYKNIPFKRV